MNNQYYRNEELLTMTDAEQLEWEQSQPTVEELALEEAKKIKDETNNAIYKELEAIDKKTIRALRSGEDDRLNDLEIEASELRAKIV